MSALLLLAAMAALTGPEVEGYDSPDAPDLGVQGRAPANYGQLAIDGIKARTFDPDAAKIDDPPPPHIAYLKNATDIRDGNVWVTCVRANLKNRMGGYTGYSTLAVIMRQGVVLDVIDRSYSTTIFESLCGRGTI